MTTVRKIAELAGVSKSTVSLVLNNKAGVSEETRQAVLKVVEQLSANALHDITADMVDPKRTLSVMVLHPPVLRSSYVFSQVLHGIQTAAETFNIQIRVVMNEPQASDQHVAHLYLSNANLRPDGVLVFGAQQHEPLVNRVVELGIPCVVLGRNATQYHVSGIGRDELLHSHNLTKHLIDLGHQQIAFVGGETCYDYTINRMNGYRKAMDDHQLPICEAWIQLGDGVSATEALLAQAPEVTAIIFVNDTYAVEGLAVLREQGRHIPNDLSVASFDDTDVAQNNAPPLTSIAYNRFNEGQWAIKMLLDQIRYPFLERSHVIFSAELIIRESTTIPRPLVEELAP
jgi:DNA-binding LacI/PurR family transcriptional regulator